MDADTLKDMEQTARRNAAREREEELMEVSEKHISAKGKPEELKLMAEALYEFANNRGMDLPKALGDWCYNVNAAYQTRYEMHEDDWDFIPPDKEQLGLGEERF